MPKQRAAKAKRKVKAAKAKAAREGREWAPRGKAAKYAANAAKHKTVNRERAISGDAQRTVGWSFGARCEGQFLALAQALAAIWEARAELESAPEWMRERALVQAASDFQAVLLGHKRELRSAGIHARFADPAETGESGPITAKTSEYSAETRFGAWERCKAEMGREDLMGTALPWWEHVSIGHAPGDMKARHEERAREVRFYHFAGREIDPEGSRYSRLVGHIPPNLPVAALRRCVDELIKAWGDNPADWRATRQEPLRDASGKLISHAPGHIALSRDIVRDAAGHPVLFPLFPELAEKLNNNKIIGLDPSKTGRPLADDRGTNEQNNRAAGPPNPRKS